ncbi:hypothetical protein AAHE18_06G176300 [Arachis hypogaea]
MQNTLSLTQSLLLLSLELELSPHSHRRHRSHRLARSRSSCLIPPSCSHCPDAKTMDLER